MRDPSQPLLSARESLRQSIDAYQLSQCLYVAAKLGIADLLKDGPQSHEQLANVTGAQPTALFRVLRALASAGVLNRLQDGRFELNDVSEYLCSEAPGSLRAWAILAGEQPYPAWGQLLNAVQTGQPGFDRVFGVSNWEYRVQNPAAAQVFNAAMSEGARASTAAIVEAYGFVGLDRIVDVGGGQGALLAGILKTNPSARGVLFDLEHVVAGAPEPLKAAGVSDRCEIVAGSFLERVPSGGDGYILKDIILNWTDQESVLILRNCRQAMKENATLLIMERIIASDQPTLEATMADLRMMVMLGGQERTIAEFHTLLGEAGFEPTKVIPTRSPYQIIEAKPVSRL